MPMHYQVHEAIWEKDKKNLRHIRQMVFIEGQNVPKDVEWDDRDEHCWHVLVSEDETPIATGRLDTTGKIGRMAVLETHRGKGAGKLVLNKLIHIARREQIERTYMHAQVHALPFYLKHGFCAVGEVYEEAGIPHQNAEEILAVENLNFSDAMDVLVPALAQSEYSLKLKLQDVNHALLCHDGFTTALRSKCISDSRYKVEVLLEKTRPNKRSADFVRAYQRLTDKIEIKRYQPAQAEPDRRQFLVIDRTIVAWQANADSSDVRLLRATDRIKNYSEDFNRMFAHAERDISLLKLYL